MAALRIRGLAKLIGTLIKVCKIIDVFGPAIRTFVPDDKKGDYDDALAGIRSACDLLRSINYLDTSGGTNAPWGVE